MPPKNKKKNSFYFFMKEMKEREAAKGYNISIHDMPTLAHPIWAKLSVAEKEKYEEMARQFKNDPNFAGGKLASDGTRIEDNFREIEEERLQKTQMIQGIKRFCNTDCLRTEQSKDIMKRKFIYFLSFNILCHTEDNIYIPIEVALIEYSILVGINREYHKIIHPGAIPTGYAGAAKRHSDDKHQIDVFGEKGAVRDVRKVYSEILAFINPHRDEEYPPVFCSETNIEITVGCLNWFADVSCRTAVFHVWDAAFLLLELRLVADAPLPSKPIADELLSKTSFDYHKTSRCEFHEEKDVPHCALTYSKRLGYLFSDAVCPHFGVALTERHLPTIAEEEKNYKVSMGPQSKFVGTTAGTATVGLRLDRRNNYYEYEYETSHESNVAPRAEVKEDRQPATPCLSEQMSRLNLNIAPATVPGHGIGRGLRRKT